jgi:hypothetical protein
VEEPTITNPLSQQALHESVHTLTALSYLGQSISGVCGSIYLGVAHASCPKVPESPMVAVCVDRRHQLRESST